jgi:beta-N-acetylglucosaminidase
MYSLEDGTAEAQSISYADVEQFPASYQSALKALKDAHPAWVFVPYYTGIDWNTAIANEIGSGKSLVYKTFPDYMKEGLYDNGSWYYASEDVLKLYMDPRNSLTENAIFQFEQLTYNESYHTEEAVDTFLNNTFMKNDHNAPGTDMTFAKIFWAIGKEKNVSPFHLAARVYQEQGQGTSELISGTYPGYEGYYNYFNVSASGQTTQEVIESGLKYAKNKNWYNAYYSILGGAETISQNYISRGQDTLYLQKFNVTSNNTFGHQYMQNISAPTTEAASIMKQYRDAVTLDSAFVFKIPVYENMPETACPSPTASTNVVLKIPTGYSATVYVDGIAYSGVSRNGQLIVTVPDGSATNAVVYSYNESGVPVGMYLWTLQYKNNAYVVTAQPELENLLTYHGFSIRITGKAGIRFKTGISEELRNRLTSEGVNGYVLKEYGTLVMNNANIASYPMIKGGEKVASGMSYGINANGGLDDKIYENVNGRLRFTSVLVGLPASQYKTEYAFRGYAILEKDGVQTTVYGPIMARSIYSLAEQVLGMGTYAEGSDAWNFLKQIMSDAQ